VEYGRKMDSQERNTTPVHNSHYYFLFSSFHFIAQNKMEFRYALLVDLSEYGSKMTEIAKSVARRTRELEALERGEDVR
jgi:hypothetical protein